MQTVYTVPMTQFAFIIVSFCSIFRYDNLTIIIENMSVIEFNFSMKNDKYLGKLMQ